MPLRSRLEWGVGPQKRRQHAGRLGWRVALGLRRQIVQMVIFHGPVIQIRRSAPKGQSVLLLG
jgi:hypothetical protein